MLFIYDKNAKSFNNEGLGSLTQFVSDPEITYSNGFCDLQFSHIMMAQESQYLTEGNIIKTQFEKDGEYVQFTIYETEKDNVSGIIYVNAELRVLHELKHSVVKAHKYTSQSPIEMITEIQHNLDPAYDIRIIGNSKMRGDFEHEDVTAYNAIFNDDGITNAYQLEVKYIDLGMKLGNTLGRANAMRIREADFVEELKVTSNTEEMVTRIIPFTTLAVDKAIPDKSSSQVRYKAETTETKVYGNPVLSPNVDKGYPIRTSFVEFRNERLEEKSEFTYERETGSGDDKKTETEKVELTRYKYENINALNAEASKFFENNIGVDEPKMSASLNTLGLLEQEYGELTQLKLHDNVEVLLKDGQVVHMKVVEVTYDGAIERNIGYRFDNKSITTSQAEKNINRGKLSQDALSEKIRQETLEREKTELINYVYNQAGNRLEFTNVLPEPDGYREGDMIFLEDGDNQGIYVLENGTWVLKVDLNFSKVVEDLVNTSIKEMKQTQIELEKRMTEIDKIKASIPNFDDLKSEIEAVRKTSQVNAEMIGHDGITRYNKNLLIGEFNRKLEMRDLNGIEVMANDGGFKAGETYTISFEAVCEIVQKVLVKFGYNLSVVEDVMYQLAPDFEKFPEVEATGDTEVYPDTYHVTMTSDWYVNKDLGKHTLTEAENLIEVNLEYKPIADGDKLVAEWQEEPRYIFDGGGS